MEEQLLFSSTLDKKNFSKALINKIKWLQAVGVEYYLTDQINKQPKVLDIIDNSVGHKISNSSIDSRALASMANSLDELKASVLSFDGCELKKFAQNTVFADGVPSAKIMCIGEAPGAKEDELGIPFCGDSGKLLDNILASINLSRKTNTYITNTIFWRPPGNRPPTQEEILLCRPFVEKHIALIQPRLIILVGNTAAQALLPNNLGISKIRNEYYSYSNEYLKEPIPMTAIYHPAYLLRQPLQKRAMWSDMLKIQDFILSRKI